jgi:sialate O-acetylesterase
MAVAIDLGERASIHPKNKREVGRRLSLVARALVYGEQLVYSGPLFRRTTREDGVLRLRFDHTGGGLVAHGGALRGFEAAGADRLWMPAVARIEGHTTVVSSPSVPAPLHVRYGWADFPDPTRRESHVKSPSGRPRACCSWLGPAGSATAGPAFGWIYRL